MNTPTATDAESGDTDTPAATSTRPTTGYALAVEARADTDAFGHLVAAVSGLGADIRRTSSDGDTRQMLIACSGTDHQIAVRATLAGVDGVELISLQDATFALHESGKIRVQPTAPLDGPDDLAMAYTPGVGRVSTAIAEEPSSVWHLTGRSNAVAVLSNGTAWCWGRGDYGQLGNGPAADSSTPVQVSSLTNAVTIAVGDGHACAVRSDSTAWCWGHGGNGQLGNDTCEGPWREYPDHYGWDEFIPVKDKNNPPVGHLPGYRLPRRR